MSDATQGTDAWREARLGKVTASRVSDVIAKTKTGWGASRANYMAELLAERLTGVQYSTYTNAAMQWGTENEPEARAAYSFRVGQDVTEVGFIDHPFIAMSGASPDGEVGGDGLVEIKCPNTATHVDTLLGDPIEGKYVAQMQWQMGCTGRQWCDWVSYDPRLPEAMRLFVKRVPRDDAMIIQLEKNVEDFLAELDAKVAALEAKYGEREAANAA
jgi:putative phage-type endonuclease